MASQRESNIELYRIIAMVFIVAHHFSLHSGLIDMAHDMSNTMNALFILLFGMWGKIGINCYLMITGYHMCTSNISMRKWLKLVGWIWFYNALCNSLFMLTGYVDCTARTLLRIFMPIGRVGSNFASTFVVFYLFIPFLNMLIRNMTKHQHQWLLVLLTSVFVILPYFPVYVISFNYLVWFITVYFFASYLRLYVTDISVNKHFWGIASLVCVCLSMLSVIVGACTHIYSPYDYVMDSNALLALPTALTTFMYFKNLKIRQSTIVNTVAAACFGVLLIHDNSAIMHQWLWHDLLHVGNLYTLPISELITHSVLIVLIVYATCTIIDIIRLYVLERPVLYVADKYLGTNRLWYNR